MKSKNRMFSVTKEEFINAYKAHPANAWTKLAFKYFSGTTPKEKMAPKRSIVTTLVTLFFIGFIWTVLNWAGITLPREIILYSSWALIIGLGLFYIFLTTAWFMNMHRLGRIRKKLNLNYWEFKDMAKELL